MLLADTIGRKEKGQDQIHLAQHSGHLMDKTSFAEVNKNISLEFSLVKNGKRKSLLPAFTFSFSTPQEGFEPSLYPSAKDFLIQLEDRGDLIRDKESILIDNISNYINRVNQFMRPL